jgi:hypothetical protein
LADHARNPSWGFKDPRTLLTLQGWLELGITPSLIGIFRAPWAVASSLAQRSPEQTTPARALELWHIYNSHLLELQQRHAFPLLCFDWEEAVFHSALERAAPQLGLPPPPADERFYAADLVHHTIGHRWLPWKVNRLYKKLRAISDRYR